MSWSEFLRYLLSPVGVGAAVGLALYYLADYWPGYHEWAPKTKRIFFALLCLLFPLGAATLLGLGGFVPWSWDPLYWDALQAAAAAFTAGTLRHTPDLPSGVERDMQRQAMERFGGGS